MAARKNTNAIEIKLNGSTLNGSALNGIHAEAVLGTARTAEQQAELDTLRAKKAASQYTIPVPAAAPIDEPESEGEFIKRMIDSLPSGKRAIAAFVIPMIVSGFAGYGIGTLAAWAINSIAFLSSSLIMQWVVIVMALCLAAYTGFKIGQHLGGYILSGQIDKDLGAVKDTVFGWFKSKDPVIATAPVAAPVAVAA